MAHFEFPAPAETPTERKLRAEVRGFLAEELSSGGFSPRPDCWNSHASPEFSARLGARGWLGMTWPKAYGGHERSALERLVVTEELLAAGAPVTAHWIADRQTGAQILRHGSEAQKREILPRIAAGKCFTAIGMSESQAGSDLAAVRTRAERTASGWRLNGLKLWSSGAHIADYMVVLARTSAPQGSNRQIGLSQFLVPLASKGVGIDGIRDLAGSTHFNETRFEDVDLPEEALLGEEGNGWAQVMGELSFERSGPERFLSTVIVLREAIALLENNIDATGTAILGRLLAHLAALRRMSRGVAALLQQGRDPSREAAMVKLLGNEFERQLLADLRRLLSAIPEADWPVNLVALLTEAQLRLPSFTLRGGTTEVMRGILARQLGVR
jgi:alkylation response protein AidB-like acyl-CoA dehydrogenase